MIIGLVRHDALISPLPNADENNTTFQEYSVASLLGHSHYKSGNISRAIEHYESVDMMYERPEDIHLVHLRMGFHFIDAEEYDRARNIFLRACKHTPTCKTWLGVGVSSYHVRFRYLYMCVPFYLHFLHQGRTKCNYNLNWNTDRVCLSDSKPETLNTCRGVPFRECVSFPIHLDRGNVFSIHANRIKINCGSSHDSVESGK